MADVNIWPLSGPRPADYPFVSRWFDHGRYRQHYLDEGDGPPVLMLHGNPSWSYGWRRVIVGLRDGYRCVVPDHVGMGLSARPGEDLYAHTLSSRVDDLAALVNYLVEHGGAPASGWTLAMHDWGGPIGMALAARMPHLVSRLVVLNTAAFLGPYARRLPVTLGLALWGFRNLSLAAYLVLRHNAFARGAARFGTVRKMPPAVRAGYLAPYGERGSRLGILRFVQDIPRRDGDPAMAELLAAERAVAAHGDRPVFIGWGMRDPVLRPALLDEWRRRFPHAMVRAYRDAGHYVLEDAGDELVGEIRTFLSTRPVEDRRG